MNSENYDAIKNENQGLQLDCNEETSVANDLDTVIDTKKTKKKPFFKRPGGIVLIVVLVLLIGGGTTAYILRDKIIKWILGPVDYYLYKEYQCVSAVSSEDFSFNGKLSLGDEFASVYSMLGIDTSNIRLDVASSKKKNKTKVYFNFADLLEIDYKQDKNYMSFSYNGGEEFVAKIGNSEPKKKNSNKKAKKEVKPFYEQITGKGMVGSLFWAHGLSNDCLLSSFGEKKIVEGEETYKGMDCDTTTFKIDDKVVKSIYTKLADKVESDDETANAVKNLFKYENKQYSSDLIYDRKKIVENLRDTAKSIRDSFKYEYKVYYYDGDIVNRKLRISNEYLPMDFSVGSYEKDDNLYVELVFGSYLSGELKVNKKADVSGVNIDKSKSVSLEEFMTSLFATGDTADDILGFGEDEISDDMNYESDKKDEESTAEWEKELENEYAGTFSYS